MSKTDTIPAQIEAEKLCKHTLIITNNLDNFPTKYRFTLVDRILRISFDIYDLICDANNSYDMGHRIRCIEDGISACRKLKFYIRLCKEVLKPKCSIRYWDGLVSEIEDQLSRWRVPTKRKYMNDKVIR